MKEHPLLFSPPMVVAIQQGLKTQTRRILKFSSSIKEHDLWILNGGLYDASLDEGEWGTCQDFETPDKQWMNYSKINLMVGDTIWVKEAHYRYGHWQEDGKTESGKQKWRFIPITDFPSVKYLEDPPDNIMKNSYRGLGWYKRNSLFMPRELARIFLEITNIRVERIKEISVRDCEAEGIEKLNQSLAQILMEGILFRDYGAHKQMFNEGLICKESFKSLWFKINGRESWNANPFVWAIDFKKK